MSNLKLKCMRKLIGLFVFLTFVGIQICFSQTREITGTVIDKHDKSPLPGVSVVVKGNPSTGVATDVNGKFSLKVNDSDVLVFSFIGMKPQEVAVKGQTNLTIELEPASETLDEVMVVAYGTAKKESFTGSAEVVSADKLQERTVANVTKALDGQVAGVISTSGSGQPGSGASVRIRGYGSINASSNPLYVVDGVPYDGNINAINPNDIETLTVLKDASAGALYGARGANGVVMITTKRGKNGHEKINLTLKANVGISDRAIPRYETLNTKDWLEMTYRAYYNDYVYVDGYNANYVHDKVVSSINNTIFSNGIYNPYDKVATELFDANGKIASNAQLKYNEDWMDEIETSNPIRQEYTLTADGGTEKTKYMLSMSYLNEDGLLKETSFERYTGRVNVDMKPKEWLNIGLGANYSRNKTDFLDFTGASTSNVWYSAQLMAPIYPVYEKDAQGNTIIDANGKKVFDYGKNRPAGAQANFNCVATLYEDKMASSSDNVSARGFFELAKWGFKFRTNIGIDNVNTYQTTYYNPIFGNAAGYGRLSKYNSRTFSYTMNELLSYEKKIGEHAFDIMAGHEFYSYKYNYLMAQKTGFPFAGIMELGPGTTIADANSYEDNYTVQSFLSRANYNYAEKYYLSASFRTDGSSRFHKDNRWGKFWSVGASWRLSQEEFMDSFSNWLDNATLKASYGVQGNDNIGSLYAWQSFYDLGYANAGRPGAAVSSLETPALKWELSKNLNIGLEVRIFNRLNATVEWYKKKTTDMLLAYPMATSLGFDSYNANAGSMTNTGWDITLSGDIIKTNDWNWNMTLMGSTIKNKVNKLTKSGAPIISGSRIIKEGEELYAFYVVRSAGVDPMTGSQLYYAFDTDINGDKIKGSEYVTADRNLANGKREIFGSRIPDLYGSISNSVHYKGIDFSILLTYSIGGKMLDGIYNDFMNPLYMGQGRHKHSLRAWQKPGDITDIPRLTANPQDLVTDKSLIDASYLSIKNIQLGYTFGKKLLGRSGIETLRVYATADNLAIFTHLKGMDPQYNFTGGTDYSYTPNRVFSLGVDLKF